MSIEDIALMTSLPNFSVIVPSDEISARALVWEMAKIKGPMYMRAGRPKAPVVHDLKTTFEIGKAVRLREGGDLTIVANGFEVYESLAAAEELSRIGIQASVIDMHTVKPLDKKILLEEAGKTGRFVVAEEHQIWGGLGSAVASYLATVKPCPIEFVAIQDVFAESGKPEELLEKYGLTAPGIVKAAKKVFSQTSIQPGPSGEDLEGFGSVQPNA